MKRTLTIINLVLMTAVVYMGVHIFYKLLETKLDRIQIADTYQPPSATAESNPVPQLSSYKAVTQRNLFKIENEKPNVPAKPVAIEEIKETELKLKLWGTVIDDDGKAYAVIEDPAKGEQNLYLAGDTIQNASVKTILREKVILHVNGKDEMLGMEKIIGEASGKSAQQTTQRSAPSPERAQRIILKKEQLTDALNNVNELMDEAKFRPHFQDGKPDGILLMGIKPRSIFRRMGLRNGDIILGVNDKDIRSVDDAVKFYKDLASTDTAKIQIKRRGRLRTMEYFVR